MGGAPADQARADGIPRQFLEPVLQESTPSMIAGRVREAIAHGEIAPGTRLSEAPLAARLGVSRGPLREGLQRLTQEGLLISIRNRGLFVVELTDEGVRDLYVARLAIERAAAACIHTGEPVAAGLALLAVTDEMDRAAARRDTAGVGEADIRFHQTLVGRAGSSRLGRIHRTLLTETRMCIHALGTTYTTHESRLTEHRQIAESVRDGEPATTDRMLVAHMEDAVQRLTGPGRAGPPHDEPDHHEP